MKPFRMLFAACAVLCAAPVVAQTYPDKPIRMVVGFTPGSATDISARIFAQKFSELWNVPVTVENIPGAAGGVAGDRVSKAAPDGATLYWAANGAIAINPSLYPTASYDTVRDLAPITRLIVTPSILAVNNDLPVKSVAELIALAKSKPGQLSYASPGAGTPQHIATELLKSLAGIDVVHVPYRGAVVTDVIGGRIPMTLQNSGAILPMVREGRLRGLAVTSLQRSPNIKELPTVSESGVPGFEATSWFGIFAPAGTPAPILAKINQDALKVVGEPDMREKLAKLGLDTAADGPDAFAAIIKADIAKWAKVIKDNNIKAE
jgi:tripartite-type tricarboxylate transporter receptor subunit TctC